MARGLFVSFEGIDRSGKTTQARLLVDALGDDAIAVREPGGTAVGERIRDLLKDQEMTIGPHAEALLFAAARAELVAEVVRPALDHGRVVVSDRFVDSSLAYQGVARGLGVDDVARVNEWACGGLKPDLTIFLELPAHDAAARSRRGGPLRGRGRRPAGARAAGLRGAGRRGAGALAPRRRRPPAGRGARRRAVAGPGRALGGGHRVSAAAVLEGTEQHAHARMVLGAAIEHGTPSHAYLFHGPPGTGKRTAARALAAELLAEGADDPDAIRRRVAHGAHPDLTWVKPTGAHVMRVGDIEEPVVAAANRTPFEAKKRVFVLERADTMNDEVANRMLKTLEEPPAYVHLILLTDALGRMLETVVSRCQLVRFDPLPAGRLADDLQAERRARRPGPGLRPAGARQRHARAATWPSDDGEALRADVDAYVRAMLAGESRAPTAAEPWRPLLVRAEERRDAAEKRVAAEAKQRLELEPKGRERKALEKEFEEMAKRDGRRARTEMLDLGLELTALAFRDLLCVAEGAHDAVLATDRCESLAAVAHGRDPRRLRDAVDKCEDTRLSLELNVSEDLALTALSVRLEQLVGASE